jgi:DNA-binding response OmpR family regulator
MHHSTEPSAASNQHTIQEPAAAPHPPRVLVVEDDRDFADVLRFELESDGYEVEVTSSVTEAQRRMRVEDDLDLVISDVRLPGKSGIQLLFGEEGGVTPPPVLMMSGYTSAKLRELVEGMGAAVIEKPFSFASLHANVVRILEKAASVKAERHGLAHAPAH